MNSEQLHKYKQKLENEKDRLLKQISRLEETGMGDAMADSIGELSVYDNHPADIGDELFERSKDSALQDNAHILLENVEKALAKITDNTYGYCDNCGNEIPLERLEALPWANQCIKCQHQGEPIDPTPRPVEEEILEPPFHRTFLDTAKFNFVGFDGEDALQAVLRYGSSDTPQDIPGSYDYKALFPNSNEHQGIVDRADSIPAEAGHNTRKKNDKAER